MDFMPFGGIWLLFAMAMQIAVLVLVVLGIVWLVRRLSSEGSGHSRGPARSAREELELRYARGEIDRTTYLQMRDDLNKSGSG
jgi:putative membrane protein